MSVRRPIPGQFFWLERSSIDLIKAIGPTAFAVLATIASHADEKGVAFPSISGMATRLGMHRGTVQRAVQALIDAKLLAATGRCDETGAQTSNSFMLLPPEIPVAPGAHPPVANEAQGCSARSTPPALEALHPPVAPGAHEQEPFLTRTNEQEKETAKPSSSSVNSTFAEWWKVYPKKAGKRDAVKAYPKALKAIAKNDDIDCDNPVNWLLAKTIEFAASDKAKGEYCPNPATFLNGERYADDPATWRESQGKQRNKQPIKQFSEIE